MSAMNELDSKLQEAGAGIAYDAETGIVTMIAPSMYAMYCVKLLEAVGHKFIGCGTYEFDSSYTIVRLSAHRISI